MDNLVSILRGYGITDQAVRAKILALIQSWALAFKSKYELMYVSEIYEMLKREGEFLCSCSFFAVLLLSPFSPPFLLIFLFLDVSENAHLGVTFPAIDKSEISSAMIDTQTVYKKQTNPNP
jgi:hypothetical protein